MTAESLSGRVIYPGRQIPVVATATLVTSPNRPGATRISGSIPKRAAFILPSEPQDFRRQPQRKRSGDVCCRLLTR